MSAENWVDVGLGKLHPIIQHLREVAADMPRLNNKGQFYWLPKNIKGENVVGVAAGNAKVENVIGDEEAANVVKKHCPALSDAICCGI